MADPAPTPVLLLVAEGVDVMLAETALAEEVGRIEAVEEELEERVEEMEEELVEAVA